jgi:hypothetical protein
MPKDAFWFPHDSNARNDQFILEMRAKHGSQGYGWFWMLVEMMRDESQYRLRVSNCNAFAMQLNCQPDAVSVFIDDCIQKYKLFASDGEWFWSDSLRRRMRHKDAVSRERSKVAQVRWSKAHANAMQLHNNCKANAMQNDAIREEEKKEENNREECENGGCASDTRIGLTPYQKIVDLYHDTCRSFPRLKSITKSRKEKMHTRWGEHPGIPEWGDAFSRMEASNYCKGEKGWKATFDWLIDNDKNMVKVLEGNYDNKGGYKPPPKPLDMSRLKGGYHGAPRGIEAAEELDSLEGENGGHTCKGLI